MNTGAHLLPTNSDGTRIYIPPPMPDRFDPLTGRIFRTQQKQRTGDAPRLKRGNSCWLRLGALQLDIDRQVWMPARKWFESTVTPGKTWFIVYPFRSIEFVYLASDHQVRIKCPVAVTWDIGPMPEWAGDRQIRLLERAGIERVISAGRLVAV